MTDELTQIVVAATGDGYVVFDGTPDTHMELYAPHFNGILAHYSTDERRKKFIALAKNGPSDENPHYWKVFDPLNDFEFQSLIDKMKGVISNS